MPSAETPNLADKILELTKQGIEVNFREHDILNGLLVRLNTKFFGKVFYAQHALHDMEFYESYTPKDDILLVTIERLERSVRRAIDDYRHEAPARKLP